MSEAYAVAWIGELGGIQYIQIERNAPSLPSETRWPHPVLICSAEGSTFEQAAEACKKLFRETVPAWERFVRNPARMRPIAPAMRSPAARAAAAAKTKGR